MANQDGTRSSRYALFLSVCCLALAVLVVLLVFKNRSLQEQLAVATMHGSLQEPSVVSESFFRDIGLVGDEGPVYPEYTGNGQWTLMLLFTKACGACEEVLPLWTELVTSIPASDLRVYGIRLDKTASDEEWAPAANLPFEVYGLDYAASRDVTGLAIPTTVLLDDEGNVEKAWYGMPQSGRFEGLRALIENR